MEFKTREEALAAITKFMEERNLPTNWVRVPWLSEYYHCDVFSNYIAPQQVPNQLTDYGDHFELYADCECINFWYGSKS